MARFRPRGLRPGTVSYERERRGFLNRQRALAEANAASAKRPEARQKAQKRAVTARRSLRKIETRVEFRDQLSERDRIEFNTWSLTEQDRFRAVVRQYPEYVPQEEADPFAGRHRNPQWRLYYATRAGIRRRAA